MAQPKSGISDNSYLSVAFALYKTWFHTVVYMGRKEIHLERQRRGKLWCLPKEGGKFFRVWGTFKIRRSKTRNRLLKGIVDEVGISNRVLSKGQVQQNYNVEESAVATPTEKLNLILGKIKVLKYIFP